MADSPFIRSSYHSPARDPNTKISAKPGADDDRSPLLSTAFQAKQATAYLSANNKAELDFSPSGGKAFRRP